MDVNQILAHPFVILIAGAIITYGIALPFSARVQQRQQKDQLIVQLKLDFVKRVNQAVTETIMTPVFAMRDSGLSTDEINKAYRDWEIFSYGIESDMEAILASPLIKERWADYSESLKNYFYLAVNPPEKGNENLNRQLNDRAKKVIEYLNEKNIKPDSMLSTEMSNRYTTYRELGSQLVDKKSRIIYEIYRAPSSL
jgi:hypothetical protein